jgi:hypothetical protein
MKLYFPIFEEILDNEIKKAAKEYKKIEDIPEYVKISGLEEARNEFIKSKDEKYDSDKLGLKKSNHNDVVAFLTEHTTYKPATVEKKLSAFI